MDDQIQMIKICRVCGCEREYDNYHRLYIACKNVLVDDLLNIIRKTGKKILEKAKSYRKNNKDKLKQNRKTVSSYKDDIQDLYNQISILTQMVKTTVSVS